MWTQLKVWLAEQPGRLKKYGWNLLIAMDQLLNTALFGHPDETFSARTHRKAQAGQWFWRALRRVINLLFRWESKDHCWEAYENERNRAQGPREYSR